MSAGSKTDLFDRPVDVEIFERTRKADGFRPLDELTIRHRLFDAHWSETQQRDLTIAHPVVGVVAYDPENDHLVLIRQFRLAAHLATGYGELIEIVAGGIEEGEDAEQAAARELTEETGLIANFVVRLFDFMPTPGLTDELATLVYAEVDSSELAERAGTDRHETTWPLAVPADQALDLLDDDATVNGFLRIGLSWFDRARRRNGLPVLENG